MGKKLYLSQRSMLHANTDATTADILPVLLPKFPLFPYAMTTLNTN
ncbi:hypothetical protein SAMN02745866_02286 [Alteromonadaceae bacterium Bs31]|nr:hypothetical protein SAMN02745866_02286 [Alteromonadaceae bacterium Bs31]